MRPDKITLVQSDQSVASQLHSHELPPKQVPDTSVVAPMNPSVVGNHATAAAGDARPANATDNSDVIICRPPRQLPASHFFGPKTCRTRALWDQYRRDGMEIAPDGIEVVSVNGARSPGPHACPSISGGIDIATKFGLTTAAVYC